MSLGFSPSDVLTLINLTKRTYDGWRSAGERFEDITDTLHGFKVLLVQVYNRLDALDLAGSRQGKAKDDLEDRRKDTERILHGCKSAVSQLAAIARKHQKLRTWDRVRLGLKDISAPKEQLVRHIGMLTPYLLMTEMESIGQDVRLIPDSFNSIPAMIQSAVTVAFGNMLDNQADDRSSVLTTYGGEDDKRAYRELRRKLHDLGVKDSIIRNHQSELLGFVKSILSPDESHPNPNARGTKNVVEPSVGHSSLPDTSADPSDPQRRPETNARPHIDAEHGSSEGTDSDSDNVDGAAIDAQENIDEIVLPPSKAYQAYVESDDEVDNPSSPEQDPKQDYNHEKRDDIDPEEDHSDRLREKRSSEQIAPQTSETKHVLSELDSSKDLGSEQLPSIDDHGLEESDKKSTIDTQRIYMNRANHGDRVSLDSHAETEEYPSEPDESDVESQRPSSSARAVRNEVPWEESELGRAKAGNVLNGRARYSSSSESDNDDYPAFGPYSKRSATQGKRYETTSLPLDHGGEYYHRNVGQGSRFQDAHSAIPRIQRPQANRLRPSGFWSSSLRPETVKPVGSREDKDDLMDDIQRADLPLPQSRSPYQGDRRGTGQEGTRTFQFPTNPQASSGFGGFSDPRDIFADFMRAGGGQESGEEGENGDSGNYIQRPDLPQPESKSPYQDDRSSKGQKDTHTFHFSTGPQASSGFGGFSDPRDISADFMRAGGSQERGEKGLYGGQSPLPPLPPAPRPPPRSLYGDIRSASSSGARTFSLSPPSVTPPPPLYGDVTYTPSSGTRTNKFSSPHFSDPRDVFAEFMRGQDSRDDQFIDSRYKPRDAAVETTIVEKPLAVSLEDMFNGTTKKLKVQRKFYDQRTGHRGIEDKILSVPIKRGLQAGSKIKYPNMGDQDVGTVQDLHFIVKEKPHPLFTREGNDIRCTIDISLAEAQNGWKRAVLTIDGRQVNVSSKGPTGSTWTEKFPSLGMPLSKKPSERGDFIVGLRIVV